MTKHLFLFLGTSCLCLTSLHAQNWVNGGNTLAADGRLGTNNAYALIFETNNSERGRITNSGIWSIGTTPKTAKFTVNSAAGQHAFRVMVAEATKLIVNSNGGTTIGGSTTVGPANGLYVSGSVGIGTATPSYKLHVEGGGISIYGNSTSGTGVLGKGYLYGVNGQGGTYGTYGGGGTYGVYGAGGAYGVYGTGTSRGVWGYGPTGVYGTSNYSGGDGVRAFATGTGSSWGLYAYSQYSHGIYATTSNSGAYAGYFAGSIYVSGTYGGSDRKLKQNITDMGNAIEVINKLQPKEYEYRQDGNFKLMNLPKGKHYGLIAQDLEQVLPNLVKETEFHTEKSGQAQAATPLSPQSNAANPQGQIPAPEVANETKDEIINFKAVNYTELIPIMVKAMQEQNAENSALKKEVAELRQLVQELKTTITGYGSNFSSGFLKGSTPNPAKSTALIDYFVPPNSRTAHIVFTDMKGAILNSTTLNSKGTGQLSVSTAAWAAGTYTYTLYINGTQTDSKKLVILR